MRAGVESTSAFRSERPYSGGAGSRQVRIVPTSDLIDIFHSAIRFGGCAEEQSEAEGSKAMKYLNDEDDFEIGKKIPKTAAL